MAQSPRSQRATRSTMVTQKPPGVILLIIDPQVDFHEGGSLAISGATADSERITKMIRFAFIFACFTVCLFHSSFVCLFVFKLQIKHSFD